MDTLGTQETMDKAFKLVDPTDRGAKDWREPIRAWVTEETLTAAGVTITEVEDAIRFYTATEPKTERLEIIDVEYAAIPMDPFREPPGAQSTPTVEGS